MFYIKQHLGCTNSYSLYQGCKILFNDAHINEAKVTLLDTCTPQLNEFDPETLKKVRGGRNNTVNRSKVDMEINDIISIMSSFSTKGKVLDILRNDEQHVSYMDINPELVNPFGMLDQITALSTANTALSTANAEIMQKYISLQTKLSDLEQSFLNLSIAHGHPSGPPPVATSPPAPLPHSPPVAPTPEPGSTTSSPPTLYNYILTGLYKKTIGTAVPSVPVPPKGTSRRLKATKPLLSGKQMHERDIAITKASSEATAYAIKQGKDRTAQSEMAQVAAVAAAKTFASVTSKSTGNPNVSSRPAHSTGARPRTHPTQAPGTSIAAIAAVPKPSSYKRGTAPNADSGISIAAKSIRPSHLDNKCLVVSKINYSTTKEEFKSYVNMIAKKEIDILYIKEIQRKDLKKWRTAVLELSPEDYALLSDENLWDPDLGIKEFSGYKYWRNQRQDSTANTTIQPNTIVGQSWEQV